MNFGPDIKIKTKLPRLAEEEMFMCSGRRPALAAPANEVTVPLGFVAVVGCAIRSGFQCL